MSMIYICETCGFLFSRMGEVGECPSCEKYDIRIADSDESQSLQLFYEGENTKLN